MSYTECTLWRSRLQTSAQICANQMIELHRYCAARGWEAMEYVDTGISGAKDRCAAHDRSMYDARNRRVDGGRVLAGGSLRAVAAR